MAILIGAWHETTHHPPLSTPQGRQLFEYFMLNIPPLHLEYVHIHIVIRPFRTICDVIVIPCAISVAIPYALQSR